MSFQRRHIGTWLIALSLLLAMLLTIEPLPDRLEDFRPQWVALTLIFWCLLLPHRVGVFWGFCSGLLLDGLTGSLLGQHALGLSMVCYLTLILEPRVRLFTVWQQCFVVWVVLLVERLLTLWVIGASGQPMPPLGFWIPAFVGLMLWPALAMLAKPLRRRLGNA